MRKKELLAIILDKLLPQRYIAQIKSVVNHDLIILAYHRVKNVQNLYNYNFDSELISANTSQFEYQMSYIRKYYNPISEKQLLESIEHNIKLPKRSVLVTFDDGFDDNYYNAFPILKKYSIPAVIFLATDFIGSNEPIWFDWLAALVFSSRAGKIRINGLDVEYIRGDFVKNRGIMTDLIIRLRKIENIKRLNIIDQLKKDYSEYLEVDYTESRALTWDQIREMNNSIITFGSHTVSHPVLSRLNKMELITELSQSKKLIEENIGVSVNSIAYPTGMAESYSLNVVDETRSAGYKLGYTYMHGNNSMPISDVFSLRRLHIESHITNSYFNTMLNYPMIFKD